MALWIVPHAKSAHKGDFVSITCAVQQALPMRDIQHSSLHIVNVTTENLHTLCFGIFVEICFQNDWKQGACEEFFCINGNLSLKTSEGLLDTKK